MIGVNSDLPSLARKAVKEKNLNWRSFQNKQPDYVISKQWAVDSWPTTFVLDATGKIRFKDLADKSLDDAITKLLAEMDVTVDLSTLSELGPEGKNQIDPSSDR